MGSFFAVFETSDNAGLLPKKADKTVKLCDDIDYIGSRQSRHYSVRISPHIISLAYLLRKEPPTPI